MPVLAGPMLSKLSSVKLCLHVPVLHVVYKNISLCRANGSRAPSSIITKAKGDSSNGADASVPSCE